MPTLSVTVPAAEATKLLAALREHYGSAVSGMTDANVAKYAIRQHFSAIYRAYAVRTQAADAVSAHQATIATAVKAEQDAAVVRAQAEAAANVDADSVATAIT